MDNSGVVVIVLLATVLLRVGLVLGAIWLLIPVRAHCPRCGDTGLGMVVSRAARLLRLERRWCLTCGWEGLSKRTPVVPASATRPAGTTAA